jgi:hypothetical protein
VPDTLERLVRRDPLRDEVAHALDGEKGGVPLVHVEDRGPHAERLEDADAADAEQQLLPDAVLAVAAVERVGEPLDLEHGSRTSPACAGSTGW